MSFFWNVSVARVEDSPINIQKVKQKFRSNHKSYGHRNQLKQQLRKHTNNGAFPPELLNDLLNEGKDRVPILGKG